MSAGGHVKGKDGGGETQRLDATRSDAGGTERPKDLRRYEAEGSNRLTGLRRYEADCYRICHHLLQAEPFAVEAAQCTLLALYGDDRFWATGETERGAMLRRLAVRHSLEQKKRMG